MKSFSDVEREAFSAIDRLKSAVNIVDSGDDALVGVLAKLADELRLSEPADVVVTKDSTAVEYYSAPSPFGAFIIALATDAASDSVVQSQVDDHMCRAVVSFPERLANALETNNKSASDFDAEVFWGRLIDTALLFYFANAKVAEHCDGVVLEKQRLWLVLGKLVQLLIRRGKAQLIVQRTVALPPALLTSENSQLPFAHFFQAAFDGCQQQKFSLAARKASKTTEQWYTLVFALLDAVEKRPNLKTAVWQLLTGVMNDYSTESRKMLADAVFDAIFGKGFFFTKASRALMRTLFVQLLPNVAGSLTDGETLTAREASAFTAVFLHWDNKAFVTSGNLQENLAVSNAVMYAMMYLHNKKPPVEAFPQKHVGALLNGVSLRLDSTRGSEMRTCAMAVAAGFATLFVSNAESVSPLLQDTAFAGALETWMNEEPSAGGSGAVRSGAHTSVKSRPQTTVFSMRRAGLAAEVFPLDPDQQYSFFISADVETTRSLVPKPLHQLSTPATAASLTPAALPAFGQQTFAKDELGEHVSILRSVRECYNALVGVGRSPNAQMHEVQEATESGLRGLADAFAKLEERIGTDLFNSVSKETGPLIATLLPTLISLSIHAPDAEKQFLLQLRYDILVKLVVLNPLICASQLSGMLYRSNYGIYQRNELIKAIGEAALHLSAVEKKDDRQHLENALDGAVPPEQRKRVYPPIASHQLSGVKTNAIVVSEGQHTRRWGNADPSRMKRRGAPKQYTNYLGEFAAAFIAAFLYKLDADHFAFFQSSDPYTPCAILDALTAIFQGVSNVRHVAPELCEKNFDFFFVVATTHPIVAVKQAAWTSLVEVMRAWCGVGPLWVRQKNGERVLNRDAGLHRSLMFTQTWLQALDLLQQTCEKMLRGSDACSRTALIAVSTLRDLVSDRDDYQSMVEQASNFTLRV